MVQKNQSFFDKNAVMIKVVVVAFLALALLIPTSMISSLVMERQGRLREATFEIGSKWGLEQKITGPILTVPYYAYYREKEDKQVSRTKHFAHFLPEDIKVNGVLNPEVRYRGIFQVAVYNADLNFSGFFKNLVFFTEGKNIEIDWAGAFITMGISDLRGISESVTFSLNGTESGCEPGSRIRSLVESGITVAVPLNEELEAKDINFSFSISLNGSQGISFIPVGKETSVSITSSWDSPSFVGAFLPVTREVTSEGFEARWRVLELNRNFPQQWTDDNVRIDNSAFGVSLMLPMDKYQITERSMKYAVLFIALTFMVFFFVEILQKLRVHPIQYALVGFGLVLFYLLLLSLSEHLNFSMAYILASLGIVAMITIYSASIFINLKLTVILSVLMIALYGFLYILLQLQDYALLMGSIGLFIILSGVMYLTRKVDWYSVGVEQSDEITD